MQGMLIERWEGAGRRREAELEQLQRSADRGNCASASMFAVGLD